MKTIVITAGGTKENIDAVRAITNTGTGSLGARIADEIYMSGVRLIYIHTKGAIKPQNVENWIGAEFIPYEVSDTKSVLDAVMDVMANYEVDWFIHSMAISDYMVEGVYDDKGERIDNSKKISSDMELLNVKLVKTPKIINLIKELNPKTKLIGFKLLNNVEDKDLINAAKHQIEVAHSDYVLANDSSKIDKNSHRALFIDKNGNVVNTFNTKDEIAEGIFKTIFTK